MSETKPQPTRLASWEDVFITIVLSWMGTKILDFLWKVFRTRIRFVGEAHVGRYLFVMFGEDALLFIFGWWIGVPYETRKITKPQDVTESEFDDRLLRFLLFHMRYHDYIGNRPCRVCPIIYFYRNDLEKYIARAYEIHSHLSLNG
jgi:hypothetical protein